jgi:magnesium transporter
MIRDIIHVLDSVNREDVAKLVAKYDFMALPVVDEQRHLVGIITFDDIIDVIQDEATEDIYKITGTSQDALDGGAVKSARARLPWLFITLTGELFSGVVIAFYQGKIEDFLVLASFMPVIMAMGGNVGSQSSTITVRNLALGKIDPRKTAPILWKEIRVGLLMGLISAIPAFIIAPLVHAGPYIGVIVCVALFCAMSFAAFTGTLVPITLMRFKVDPAVASGPFISTLNDITGLTIYFSVAIALLSVL